MHARLSSSFGGFIGLETTVPGSRAPTWPGPRFWCGRAALAAILRHLRARRLWLPFYLCDSVLDACAYAEVEPAFYAVDPHLRPRLPARMRRDDALLLVNYFGLAAEVPAAPPGLPPERIIHDHSQAFYAPTPAGRWSFDSARKFFGVPDGATVRGSATAALRIDQPAPAELRHLEERVNGSGQRAYQLFRKHDRRFDARPRAASLAGAALLAGLDRTLAARRRRRNFAALERLLGRRNQLGLVLQARGVPSHYPFLPARPIPHPRLHERGLFVPCFWREVVARERAGFAWERRLAETLLPLPIDQRYRVRDMEAIAELVTG